MPFFHNSSYSIQSTSYDEFNYEDASSYLPELNCTETSTRHLTDVIQIGYQLVAAAIGIPLNTAVFVKIVQCLCQHYRRILCLNLFLCIANLLVLLICIWYTIWLFEFWWLGGAALCKLFSFLHAFVFYLYSNATVSLAVEMLIAIRFPFFNYQHSRSLAVALIGGSLIAATAASMSQFFMWDLQTAHCSDLNRTVAQCLFTATTNRVAYSVVHNMIVFWVPLGIIVPAYLNVTLIVLKHYKSSAEKSKQKISTGSTGSKLLGGGPRLSLRKQSLYLSIVSSRSHGGVTYESDSSASVDVPAVAAAVRRASHRHSTNAGEEAGQTTGFKAGLPKSFKTGPGRFVERLGEKCLAARAKLMRDGFLDNETSESRRSSGNEGIADLFLTSTRTRSPSARTRSPSARTRSPSPSPGFVDAKSRRSSSAIVRHSISMGSPVISGNHLTVQKMTSGNGLRRTFRNYQRLRSKRLKVVKSTMAIITVYMVSWFPYQICSIWDIFGNNDEDGESSSNIKLYLECFEAFMIVGTIVNPFLYRFATSRTGMGPRTMTTQPHPNSVASKASNRR